MYGHGHEWVIRGSLSEEAEVEGKKKEELEKVEQEERNDALQLHEKPSGEAGEIALNENDCNSCFAAKAIHVLPAAVQAVPER